MPLDNYSDSSSISSELDEFTAESVEQQQQAPLRIHLHRTGLSLEPRESTEKWFLDFETLSFSLADSTDPILSSLDAIHVVGKVRLGPGYLIAVVQEKDVFSHKETTIKNITKCQVIALKYELAVDSFKVPSDPSSSSRMSTDSEPASLGQATEENEPDQSTVANTGTDNPLANLTQQITNTRDMLFSRMGVYANDLKSNASLALSNKKVNQLIYGVDDPSQPNEELDSDSSSFKLNRAITLRGIPKKVKENNLLMFLERARVRKYEKLNLDCHISSEMLYKFERQLETFYSTGDFYYSTEIDLTRHIYFEDETLKTRANENTNPFFYNEHISSDLPASLRITVIQGFVKSVPMALQHYDETRTGKLLLISKRSTNRAGSRYLRRGIDDTGNVANFVFTSQILIVENYLPDASLFTKFDILRGSIPIFFQQDPSKLKPVPYLTRPIEKCEEPFKKHFETLINSYENVACISLVERSKREVAVGDAYEKLARENGVAFDWFDFHEVCKKMRFDNVVKLLEEHLENMDEPMTVEQFLVQSGWEDSICEKTQSGIFRVNCVDCLDRTNLVQKFLAEFILKRYIFEKYVLTPPADFQMTYNNVWADNGDYISRQYSSTNALKGDYTRTSKRNYKGLINDAFLTISRYYSGYISDYFKQCFIDYLLGHQRESIFEEFESTLNVLDPNEINENLNKKNSALQDIIEELKLDDDAILIGSWSGFQSPMELNKLKLKNSTLRQVSLVVTSKNIIVVDYDEKISQIKDKLEIPISSVNHLEYGTYILSTHTSISSNPRRNIGLKIFIPHQEFTTETSSVPRTSQDAEPPVVDFITLKFPQDMDYSKVKYIIDLISKTCHSSTMENKDIMTSKEASANVIGLLENRFKKMVWG